MSRLLEIPWEQQKYLKYKYNLRPRGGSLFIFPDGALPLELKQFATEDFSYGRWQEDDTLIKANKPTIPNRKGKTIFRPRQHQLDGAKTIILARKRKNPGFLLADKTGVGKTLTGLAAITQIAKNDGFSETKKANLLVVCPKGVIPVWRQTIQAYPPAPAYMRIMVINYQQLNKLIKAPTTVKKAKRVRTKNRQTAKHGTSVVDWDYIIFDEAHHLKNYPSSSTSMAAATIAKLNTAKNTKKPFVIYSTATPGSSPLNLAVMANWLAPLISNKDAAKNVTPDGWGEFLITEGFAVKRGKVAYTWANVPSYDKNSDDPSKKAAYDRAIIEVKKRQRKDAKRIGVALTKPNAPFLMRSPKDIAGWPEQQFIPLPLELTADQRPIYEQAWTAFRNWLKLTPARSDPKGGLVQMLRYRQKASLLKVESLVEQVSDFVDAGHQVFISVEFMETLDRYKELLAKKRIKVSEISGRNTAEREIERIKFQKGETQVVLCTVVAGISLHAGETLPDGTTATAAPRISILSDLRQNPLDTLQAAGRAHRDGQNSVTYIPFFEETVDERVVESFINKQANMKTMIGSTAQEAEELEELFRKSLAE